MGRRLQSRGEMGLVVGEVEVGEGVVGDLVGIEAEEVGGGEAGDLVGIEVEEEAVGGEEGPSKERPWAFEGQNIMPSRV